MNGSAAVASHKDETVQSSHRVTPEIVDVNEVVKRFEAVRGRAFGGDVRVEIDLDPDLWPVRIRSGSLDRILTNVAATAGGTTPGDGDLTIRAENVPAGREFGQHHPSVLAHDHVCITVRNNGQAMTKEVINRILEPFFTTTEGDRGTGLGLATVYGLVTRALGIHIETELGGGTTLRIFLPATPPEAASGDAEAGVTGDVVLVVEEAVAMRRLMSRALTRAGYEVKSAGRAGKALELLDRLDRSVDVLIVDVVMPGLGKLVADRVRRRDPNVKVLYMCDESDQPNTLDAADPGSQCLRKPFTKEELVAKVNALATKPVAV